MTNLIYPSSFNFCTLRCKGGTCSLYVENTNDTLYLQLSFSEKIFDASGSTFRCDLMEAKDGGFPFLIVLDVLELCGESMEHVEHGVRVELVKQVLNDPSFFDVDSVDNEFRLKTPTVFHIHQICEVFDWILPNFYGAAIGVAFLGDTFHNRPITKDDANVFVVKKTKFPDVYELYVDGVKPVDGNHVAYVPTLALSKKLRSVFADRNSMKLRCEYHADRQKWIPVA